MQLLGDCDEAPRLPRLHLSGHARLSPKSILRRVCGKARAALAIISASRVAVVALPGFRSAIRRSARPSMEATSWPQPRTTGRLEHDTPSRLHHDGAFAVRARQDSRRGPIRTTRESPGYVPRYGQVGTGGSGALRAEAPSHRWGPADRRQPARSSAARGRFLRAEGWAMMSSAYPSYSARMSRRKADRSWRWPR